jgi:tetratricopeptide (TPR) repeat protein
LGSDCGFFTSARVPGVLRIVTDTQKQLLDAVAAHRRGDLDSAEAAYRAILRRQQKHYDATQLLGALLHQRGRNKEAETVLRRAIVLNPKISIAHNNLGNAVRALGRSEEALGHFGRAIVLDPGYADAFNNRGNALNDLGYSADALADYDCALLKNPEHANALQKSARILAELGRVDEALSRNARAIAVGRPSAEIFLRSGNVFLHLNRPNEALEDYEKALALDPTYKLAVIAKSAALEALDRPQDALENFDLALSAMPGDASLLYNKASVLKSLGRIDAACEFYRKALAIAPDDPDAKANFGMTLLLKGDFAAGWRAYEYRWSQRGLVGKRPRLSIPQWNGEGLAGRSIIVYAEQGLGDIVQFSRYLPILKGQGAEVSFLAATGMHTLLRAAYPGVRLLEDVTQVENQRFDFQCPLLSLPLHFETRLGTIPAIVPYVRADPERINRWRKRIGTHGFKVGICWQGNPSVSVDVKRSLPLKAFSALASVPGVRLIGLQKKDGLDQIEQADFGVETLGSDFDASENKFLDTMAVMECVDLVISPDTSIAHVAGALARPTWVALKHVPDWRWMLGRDDTPWYPTMRLFRQNSIDDWDGVFAHMRVELMNLARA